MEKENRFELEKYHGPGSRHRCPRCGDLHSFTLYIDVATGQPVAPNVGRCDHESGCGYHFTPKEYYSLHPGERAARPAGPPPRPKEPQRPPDYIDADVVAASERGAMGTTLAALLTSFFDADAVARAFQMYHVGAARDGSQVWWQLDALGRCRTGKVIKYLPNGHRDKETKVTWAHSMLQREGRGKRPYNLCQCMFGCHLLQVRPEAVVGLVEAEKTALVSSIAFPSLVWLAVGSKPQLQGEKIEVLASRRVVLFPDRDGYGLWEEKAKGLTMCESVTINNFVKENAPEGSTMDLADFILDAAPREQPPQPEEEPSQTIADLLAMGVGLESVSTDFLRWHFVGRHRGEAKP
jgi:hypothetical protein